MDLCVASRSIATL